MDAEHLRMFLKPDTLALMIPVVAILVGGIIAIMKILIHHRERMTMIEHGIHPDYHPEDQPENENMSR